MSVLSGKIQIKRIITRIYESDQLTKDVTLTVKVNVDIEIE